MRDPEDDSVALIDLDNTIANYHKAMETALYALASPGEPIGLDRDENAPWIMARKTLIRNQPGFWRNLEPIPVGFKILEEIRAATFVPHVLTQAPQRAFSAWSEKVMWCEEHVPETLITITRDKGLVYGRLLFNDWPPYITRWLANRKRGYVVMLGHPWNEDFIHSRVFRVDQNRYEEQLPQLRALLRAVRAREEPAMPSPLLNLE